LLTYKTNPIKSHKFKVFKCDEKIFNIFSCFDEQLIEQVLVFLLLLHSEEYSIVWGESFSLISLLLLEFLKLLHLLSMGVLDLDPGRVVVLGLQEGDLCRNVILVHVGLVVNVELLEVLCKLLSSGLADGLGLLHQVVGHFIPAVVVHLIGLLVEDDFIVPLVKDSFSHVFIFFEADHLLDILLDNDDKIFIGLLLLADSLLRGVVPGGSSSKLILELEKLGDVLASYFLEVFVNLRLHLFWVSIVVSCWVDRSADFLTERDKGTTWTKGSKEFENVTICHFVFDIFCDLLNY